MAAVGVRGRRRCEDELHQTADTYVSIDLEDCHSGIGLAGMTYRATLTVSHCQRSLSQLRSAAGPAVRMLCDVTHAAGAMRDVSEHARGSVSGEGQQHHGPASPRCAEAPGPLVDGDRRRLVSVEHLTDDERDVLAAAMPAMSRFRDLESDHRLA